MCVNPLVVFCLERGLCGAGNVGGEGGRGNEAFQGPDGFTQGKDVKGCGDELRVDSRKCERVRRCELDRAAWRNVRSCQFQMCVNTYEKWER